MIRNRIAWMVPGLLAVGILLTMAQCYAASPKVVAVAGETNNYGTTLFLMDDGTVWACGENDHGQLGIGSMEDTASPVQVPIDNVVAITTMQDSALALKKDGTVWVWGSNSGNILSNSPVENILTPTQYVGLDHVIAIRPHMALKSDGTVWDIWYYRPLQQIKGLSDIVVIDEQVALKNDGTVWTWLRKDDSLWTWQYRDDAVQFENLKNIKAISGDLALGEDGSVWMLFANLDGLLTDFYRRNITAVKANISDVKAVYSHLNLDAFNYSNYSYNYKDRSKYFALKNDGTVWAWGNNDNGVLGVGRWGSTEDCIKDVLEPERLEIPGNVMAISTVTFENAWAGHSLALTSDGTVWAWGSNVRGDRGNATILSEPLFHPPSGGEPYHPDLKPTKVPGIDHMTAIMTGEHRCYAVRDDGTLWGWGNNDMGQLGIGSISSEGPPARCCGGVATPTKIFEGSARSQSEPTAIVTPLLSEIPTPEPEAVMVPLINMTDEGESLIDTLATETIDSLTDDEINKKQLEPTPAAELENDVPVNGGSVIETVISGLGQLYTAIVRMIPG